METKIPGSVNEKKLENNENGEGDDFVDPWNVTSKSETGVDYDKLISICYFNSFSLFVWLLFSLKY